MATYEGEPAQKLQMIAENSLEKGNFADNITINESTVSTRDIIQNIVELLNKGYEINDISRIFHNTVAELTVRMIIKFDCENVVLSGGSFQNNILYNSVRDRLEKLGLKVFRNRQVPMNDNGIALGKLHMF